MIPTSVAGIMKDIFGRAPAEPLVISVSLKARYSPIKIPMIPPPARRKNVPTNAIYNGIEDGCCTGNGDLVMDRLNIADGPSTEADKSTCQQPHFTRGLQIVLRTQQPNQLRNDTGAHLI